MGSITPNFMIETKDYHKEVFTAEDIDDLLWCAAQYYGYDKPVLKFGIRGCYTVEEKVEMYNTFATCGDYEIQQIYEIGGRLYG